MEDIIKRAAIAIGKVIGACALWKLVTVLCKRFHNK